jgi:hypothetical protein
VGAPDVKDIRDKARAIEMYARHAQNTEAGRRQPPNILRRRSLGDAAFAALKQPTRRVLSQTSTAGASSMVSQRAKSVAAASIAAASDEQKTEWPAVMWSVGSSR